MNYYQILQVGPSANQIDIDRAYQKLAKEARFDASMSRKDIETAYRILSDPTRRALYDAALAEDGKRTTVKVKKQQLEAAADRHLSLRQMIVILLILTGVAGVVLHFHYGYLFKNFSTGDVLTDSQTGKVLGKIVDQQNGHSFGQIKSDAYLIETPRGRVWIPQDQIKRSCDKK